MFNEEEDWNDDQDVQSLSKTVLGNSQKTNSSIKAKSKVVGKKSLLRTLQTLGSVPEWKSDNPEQDSDSETEAAPSQGQTSKRKKKRRKKRKAAESSDEQRKNGDISQTVKEEPVPKKKMKGHKPGIAKINSTSAGETKDTEIPESAEASVNKPQGDEKMTRKQWKNKMKNKRKCKNKYRQSELGEAVNKTADKQEPVKINSQDSNYNSENISRPKVQQKKKERETKPLKRKNAQEGSHTSHPTAGKKGQKEEERPKSDKGFSESSRNRSKRKTDELQVEITKEQQVVTNAQKPKLSKEESLKRQKLRKMLSSHDAVQHETPAEQKDRQMPPEEAAPEEAAPEEAAPEDAAAKQSCPNSFRSRMEQRLESARFRYINEVLYTTTSGEAKRMFQQDPQAFWIYHKGYTAQVQRWPANPVDAIISYIRKKPSSLVVADFGCGDCKIARSVKNRVHCFDLASTCELVTVGDMANVPLGDCSVDIAVFCLSLMGTNLPDFLAEANRVLKTGGILKIAEVASRFDNVRSFVSALASLGFKMVSKDTEKTHFYSFEFMKTGSAPKAAKKVRLQLKPCVYKKR